MFELFSMAKGGGEYRPLLVGSYDTVEWVHLRLWNLFRISTFIKEVV